MAKGGKREEEKGKRGSESDAAELRRTQPTGTKGEKARYDEGRKSATPGGQRKKKARYDEAQRAI